MLSIDWFLETARTRISSWVQSFSKLIRFSLIFLRTRDLSMPYASFFQELTDMFRFINWSFWTMLNLFSRRAWIAVKIGAFLPTDWLSSVLSAGWPRSPKAVSVLYFGLIDLDGDLEVEPETPWIGHLSRGRFSLSYLKNRSLGGQYFDHSCTDSAQTASTIINRKISGKNREGLWSTSIAKSGESTLQIP